MSFIKHYYHVVLNVLTFYLSVCKWKSIKKTIESQVVHIPLSWTVLSLYINGYGLEMNGFLERCLGKTPSSRLISPRLRHCVMK